MFVAAICLIVPEGYTDVLGLVIGAGVLVLQRMRHGANPGARVPSPAIERA